MQAIIIDDEPKNIDVLAYHLETYCPDITLSGRAHSVKEAIPLIRNTKPDIVFLDIELPEENGFELLTYFNPPTFATIFTTAHAQYAIQAIRANACDYLLKPIDPKELLCAIEKVKNLKLHKPKSPQNTIQIPTMNGFLICNVHDILYCQANGRYTDFHLQNGKVIISSKNLGEYDFSNHSIQRIHRSHAVNFTKITEYVRGKAPYIILSSGASLRVSNQYKDQLLEILNNN